MKFRITCPCGKSLPVPSWLTERPVICPRCGHERSQAVPIAAPAPVASAAPDRSSLPVWTAPVILTGLVALSGMIVLVGWLITKPPTRAVLERRPYAQIQKPTLATQPALVSEKIPIPEEAPLPYGRGSVNTPPETAPVQRRLPAGAPEPEPPPVAPMPQAKPAETSAPPPIDQEKSPRLHSPLYWTAGSPGAGMNLMMPIEIAEFGDGKIPYTVRRLQLPDGTPRPLKLAVTPLVHDDLGSVLTRMGEGYRFTNLRNQDLFSYETLKQHDVVFLTCADLYAQDFQAAAALRKFVQQGGTLYASDLRGDLLLAAFPEYAARAPILPGVPQNIEASVVDKGMRSYLERRSIPLSFEAPDWRPAAFEPSKVTVCLKGTYRNNLGQTWNVPLLVKFQFQKGTVIFTSFHHAKNDSEIVRKLLEYLVFTAVNARSEARVKELLQRSQFAPHDLRPALLTAQSKVEGTCQHQGGRLQVAVGFDNVGAQLKVTLRSPSGQTIEYEDRGLYQLDVPKAEPGAWHYRVTPLVLPYGNFPIIVAIGGAKT
jgi:hypothetical protein